MSQSTQLTQAAQLEPVPKATAISVQSRSPLPDVLRGLAILGVLLVNMQDFAGIKEWTQTGVDRVAQALIDIFASGRFISIFAMLFAWGAAGILERHGQNVLFRRLAILFAIGMCHFIFVWHGDIIKDYAIAAFVIPFLLASSLKTLFRIVVAVVGLGIVLVSSASVFVVMTFILGVAEEEMRRMAIYPDIAAMTSYLEVLVKRIKELPSYLLSSLMFISHLWGLFALGVIAHKMNLLTQPERHLALFRKMAYWGLPFGFVLGVFSAYLNTIDHLAALVIVLGVRLLGGLCMALGYVGVLGYLAGTGRLGRWMLFAAGGRLALSNYIAQSVLMTLVFYPYAGAQFQSWGMAAAVLLGLCFGLVQLYLSHLIVQKYQHGPLEWVLRRLVYGRRH